MRTPHPTPRVRPWRTFAVVLTAAVVAAAVGGAPHANAQQLPDESTTTSSTSTTTTAPPNGSQQQPPPGEAPNNEARDEVPQETVVVPPTERPPDPNAALVAQIAGVTVAEIKRSLRQTMLARNAAAGEVGGLAARVAALESRVGQLEAERQLAVERLQLARLALRKRAVASYIGSPAAQLNNVLDAKDFNDLSRRFELLGAVVDADKDRIDEYSEARDALGRELEELVTQLDQSRSALGIASVVLEGADASLSAKEVQFAAVRAGKDLVAGGFVFPVGGPHSYGDSFGAPRMFGTAYAHLHEGTDIFATSGTPLLACERGVVIRMGSDTLGGIKLWLVGASGTRYYYAHLSAFAEGIADGTAVEAGDVVGFVGNTGNAISTPSHLHYEVHPGGGPAINPYPLLRIVEDARSRLVSPRA